MYLIVKHHFGFSYHNTLSGSARAPARHYSTWAILLTISRRPTIYVRVAGKCGWVRLCEWRRYFRLINLTFRHFTILANYTGKSSCRRSLCFVCNPIVSAFHHMFLASNALQIFQPDGTNKWAINSVSESCFCSSFVTKLSTNYCGVI